MSTVKEPLQYLWQAWFADDTTIKQPADDRYSKHDDNAEWNPSAFRDILDYEEKVPLETFLISSKYGQNYQLNLDTGDWVVGSFLEASHFRLENEGNIPRKLIYFRTVHQDYIDGEAQDPRIVAYNVGYEYKDKNGKNVQKVITIDV